MIVGLLLWTSVLAVGAVVLVKGANWMVEGGGRTAAHFGIPTIIIGLILFSFGSTLPELASSLAAVGRGRDAIPIGNVIGSNIANILLVLGASALVRPIKIKENIFGRELPLMVAVAVLLVIVSLDGKIARWEGIVLLLVFALYTGFLIWTTMKTRRHEDREVLYDDRVNIEAVKIVIGIVGVIIGAELMIYSAEFYITTFGISEGIVGLSIIALGTSLPELATATVASKKDVGDISLGNVIGANNYNILLVLGICALITPLPFSYTLYTGILVMVAVMLILTVFSYTGKVITKLEGGIMVALYFLYIIYLYIPQ